MLQATTNFSFWTDCHYDLLAPNASMTASRASGQQDLEQFASIAKEFQTIAGQVNELALQTNQNLQTLQRRTDQIQTALSGMSVDVQDVYTQVQQFSQSVDSSRHTLVLTDIEMPNMDGFTLISRCRQAGMTMPMLVISSRVSEE